MNICKHIIKESLVAGIGPLYEKSMGNYDTLLLYGNYSLYFYLHLHTGSIMVESGTFSKRGYADEILNRDKVEDKTFRDGYWEAHKKIVALIGE